MKGHRKSTLSRPVAAVQMAALVLIVMATGCSEEAAPDLSNRTSAVTRTTVVTALASTTSTVTSTTKLPVRLDPTTTSTTLAGDSNNERDLWVCDDCGGEWEEDYSDLPADWVSIPCPRCGSSSTWFLMPASVLENMDELTTDLPTEEELREIDQNVRESLLGNSP